MWNDGSVAFTNVPSGPSADPTAPNHLARKSYVDGRVVYSLQGAALQNTGNNRLQILCNSPVLTLSATADTTISFVNWFTNSPVILATPGSAGSNLAYIEITSLTTSGSNATGFTCRGFNTSGARFSGSAEINWIAIGLS